MPTLWPNSGNMSKSFVFDFIKLNLKNKDLNANICYAYIDSQYSRTQKSGFDCYILRTT